MRADISNEPSSDNLKEKHLQALLDGANWLTLWKIFHDDDWFQQCLQQSARRVLTVLRLRQCQLSDIQQEALLIFSRSLQRRSDLAYRAEKGNYASLIRTIVHRCCLKAARQFNSQLREDDGVPADVPVEYRSADDTMDLLYLINKLEQPHRNVANLRCLGKSIKEIARKIDCSERTVYRLLDDSIKKLRWLANRDGGKE